MTVETLALDWREILINSHDLSLTLNMLTFFMRVDGSLTDYDGWCSRQVDDTR